MGTNVHGLTRETPDAAIKEPVAKKADRSLLSVRRAREREERGREDKRLPGTGVVIRKDFRLIRKIVAQSTKCRDPEDGQ